MVKDGLYYGVGFAVAAGAVGYLVSPPWAVPPTLLGLFCLYFFRDPDRTIPEGPVAVSPADGKVVHVRPLPDGGARLSIFLNIFNVHVNRVPVAGRVTGIEYRAGSFEMAHRESASENNEQNTLTIRPDDPRAAEVVVRQIAGLVARRIVCYKKVGDTVEKGERFGLIKFGSRVDLMLGPEWSLTARPGDKVKGGATIIARLN